MKTQAMDQSWIEQGKNSSYEDIIHLPHHQSVSHPHMSIHDRAAQFSPFAALTGHEAAIKETARLTEKFIELDENEQAVLDGKLQFLREKIDTEPEVTVTWYQPDERKSGGCYRTTTGSVRKIDIYRKCLIFLDGNEIPLKYINRMEINT